MVMSPCFALSLGANVTGQLQTIVAAAPSKLLLPALVTTKRLPSQYRNAFRRTLAKTLSPPPQNAHGPPPGG